HKVLPPHANVSKPIDRIAAPDSPLYLLDRAQPWIAGEDSPRRAGVSAFGFGGTNFHITIEEYTGDYLPAARKSIMDDWQTELLVWRANDKAGIVQAIEYTSSAIRQSHNICLRDVAYSLWNNASYAGAAGKTAAIVVKMNNAIAGQLDSFIQCLKSHTVQLPPNAYYSEQPLALEGKLAAVFAGQGSQYPNMLREVALTFPEIPSILERADRLLNGSNNKHESDEVSADANYSNRLSHCIYTPGLYSAEDEAAAAARLTKTEIAQPALGVIEAGLWQLLQRCNIKADMAAGHSYGEYAALYAAGVFELDDLLRVSEARGRFILEASAGKDLGTMAAVLAERTRVEQVASEFPDLVVANHNAPLQCILSGSRASINAVVERFKKDGIDARVIPVGAAFHSPFVAPARDKLAKFIDTLPMKPPAFPVYSNTTASEYGNDVTQIRTTLSDHLASPVEFVAQVEAMYEAGARIFVGVGPKNVQGSMVNQILGEKPHKVIRIDDREGGLSGLLNGLATLFAEGVNVNLSPLFEGRDCRLVDFGKPESLSRHVPPPKHAWLLNGGGARPINEPPKAPLTLEEVQKRKTKEHISAATISANNTTVREAAAAEYFVQNRRGHTMTEKIQSPPEDTGTMVASGNPASYLVSSENESILFAYQETMRQFLQTQESVMLAYLTGTTLQTKNPLHRTMRPSPAMNAGHLIQFPKAAAQQPKAKTVARPAVAEAEPARSPQPVSQTGVAALAETVAPQSKPAEPVKPAEKANLVVNFDAASITSRLLDIVEDRTGYPRDMLGMEQNMEADLGIDSIKRVEIAGALLKSLPDGMIADKSAAGQALNSQKTLQGIVNWLVQNSSSQGGQSSPFNQTGAVENAESCALLPRFIIQAQLESVSGVALDPLEKGLYLVIGHDSGVTRKVMDLLATSEGVIPAQINVEILKDKSQLAPVIKKLRSEHGAVRGLFYLAALNGKTISMDGSLTQWRDATDINDKSLYFTLQQLADDLRNDGRVVVATSLGGYFARAGTLPRGIASQGGACGLLKSIKEEWPGIQVKCADLDLTQDIDKNAAHLLTELRLPGGRIEVGYPEGRRTVFKTVPSELSETPISGKRMPNPDWIVLATGGARGITAEVLMALAEKGVRLILVGRTAEPCAEGAELQTLQSAVEIRRYLLERARSGNKTMKPVEVERQVADILRDREIRANLSDLRAAGAVVDYRVADVRDESQMSALLEQIYSQYGRLDGVVHGAGIIEDKLFVDKTMESASRVIDTKVDSAFILARHLRPETLRFVVFFTSVAGRYGNTGQTDYATANEILNRLAWQLYHRWEGKIKVSAINWGPWSKTRHGSGMVSPETQRKFESLGVQLVPLNGGRQMFINEIIRAPMDQVEVIGGQGPWEERETERGAFRVPVRHSHDARIDKTTNVIRLYPLMSDNVRAAGSRGEVILRRTLDTDYDFYLTQHLLDDVPVVPAAVALEIIAETAAIVWPDWIVNEVSDLRVLRGIQLKKRSLDIEAVATASSHGDAGGFSATILLREAAKDGNTPPPMYRATVHLSNAPLESSVYQSTLQPGSASVDIQYAYRNWLFHGPCFQVIRSLKGLDRRGALADVTATTPAKWLPDVSTQNGWLFDPGLIDSAPQMAIVWAHEIRSASALPNRFGRVRRFGDGPTGKCRMHFLLYPDQSEDQIKADIAFVDEHQKLRLFIEEMECASSPALTRLGGGWKGEVSV
ncbi:MAG: SDR family NAD(P)-dependent oxidoreductase, partial [Gammaproteobacteria bacterium]|nr:SDR family NAD(P)-dependent oxidoreductase [Gammaproteobacteria bacterium]